MSNSLFTRIIASCCLGVLVFAGAESNRLELAATSGINEPARRRPVACCLNPQGNYLLIANQDTGTVTSVGTGDHSMAGEWQVGESLADLVHWRDDLYLASDPRASQLICFRYSESSGFEICWKTTTVGWPRKLQVDSLENRCYVAGLWSRQLAVTDLPTELPEDPGEIVLPARVVDLPFCPGSICLIRGDHSGLLVSDAFSNGWSTHHLDSLDVLGSGRNRSRRAGGVAVEPVAGRVCMAEQTLNHLAQAIRNDVHWGLMVGNNVRIYDADPFFGSKESGNSPSDLSGIAVPLGGASDAKADPESITFAGNDIAAITLGGVDEVAVGKLDGKSFNYYPTGRRPVTAAFSADGSRLFVCNQLDDSVTVIDLRDQEVTETISLGEQPERTLVDEGERLFFDAGLSHDGWMSCHSCHVNGHSNGFRNDNLSDQSFGAPKQVISLLGHGDTGPFAWNGSFESLTDQIRSSIENTMQSDDPADDSQVDALAAYVRSLPAPPSLAATRNRINLENVEKGRQLFVRIGCAECHAPDLWTTAENRDVGIIDELGISMFNPPSLIGVGQRIAWIHDARYSRLSDVFTEGGHQLENPLPASELNLLLEFLNTL